MMADDNARQYIDGIIASNYGFDIFVAIRSDDGYVLERFIVDEGDPSADGGYKNRICINIRNSISMKYLAEDCHYFPVTNIADDQHAFYIIPQNDNYHPFACMSFQEKEIRNFKIQDIEGGASIDAIYFRFMIQRAGACMELWAAQRITPASIPNRKKQHLQLIPRRENELDVFIELPVPVFVITAKVDFLVLRCSDQGESCDGYIITDKIALFERYYGLETMIRNSAQNAAQVIAATGIVSDASRLYDYVARTDKRYAKRLMQIHQYPVADMSQAELLSRIRSVDRWRDQFVILNDQIVIKNYKDIDNLIDLFTERYTRSEVSGQEYDTQVKRLTSN